MQKTCRVCLRSDDSIVEDVEQYVEIIRKVAQIEVRNSYFLVNPANFIFRPLLQLIISDDYPNKVCQDCANDLLNAELLREMLLECNDIMKGQVLKTVEEVIEEEVLYDDEDLLYEDVEVDYGSEADYLQPEKALIEERMNTPSRKKKKRMDVKVVLRDSKRIRGAPAVLQVREPVCRAPVQEIDAGCLKKEPSYECHYCNTPQNKLEEHIISMHPHEPLIFRCHFCDNMYQKLSTLKDHVYKLHKLRRSIPCDECGIVFSLKCRLKDHKMKAHSEERNFVCTYCNARFKLKNNLKLHMRVHSGEKRYKCEFCEKVRAVKLFYEFICK